MLTRNDDEDAPPPYSFEEFEEEDDLERLVRMFNAMEGHWHKWRTPEMRVLERLSEEQLQTIFEGGFIDARKLSDQQVDRLAEGHPVVDVLGPDWQREYGWPHLFVHN